MKKAIFMASLAIAIAIGLSASPATTKAEELNKRLNGRVLIAVQSGGATWYVNPVNQKPYFLGQEIDALNLMRQSGLGISNKDFTSFNNKAPMRLAGRILLKVESFGEAYYVNPLDLKMHYLGRPANALTVLRSFSLGISDTDLAKLLMMPQNWTVSITSSGFSPATLTVDKGAMVTWINNSGMTQTVTSDNTFNLGEIASGKVYSRVFDTMGTYNYYSINNSNLIGSVTVK